MSDFLVVLKTARIVAEPEVRYLQDGKPMVSLRVAVEPRDGAEAKTMWVNTAWWGDEWIDTLTEYQKGQSVEIRGEITRNPRPYQSKKDGQWYASIDLTGREIRLQDPEHTSPPPRSTDGSREVAEGVPF